MHPWVAAGSRQTSAGRPEQTSPQLMFGDGTLQKTWASWRRRCLPCPEWDWSCKEREKDEHLLHAPKSAICWTALLRLSHAAFTRPTQPVSVFVLSPLPPPRIAQRQLTFSTQNFQKTTNSAQSQESHKIKGLHVEALQLFNQFDGWPPCSVSAVFGQVCFLVDLELHRVPTLTVV